MTVQEDISKLITQKYVIIAISFMTIAASLFIIVWFVTQIINSIHKWRMGVRKYKAVSDFDEEYPDNPKAEMEPSINYYDEKKKDFVKNINTIYHDYNKEKTSYIIKNHNKATDMDKVDENVLFRKYDSYE